MPSFLLQDYEYRAYGASSWVCTMREVNPINDKLNTWRRKFDDNPFELFNSDTWENSDFHQMNEKVTISQIDSSIVLFNFIFNR